jgi:hypothetical protein
MSDQEFEEGPSSPYIFTHGEVVGVIGGLSGDEEAIVATVISDAHVADDVVIVAPCESDGPPPIEEVPKHVVFSLSSMTDSELIPPSHTTR